MVPSTSSLPVCKVKSQAKSTMTSLEVPTVSSTNHSSESTLLPNTNSTPSLPRDLLSLPSEVHGQIASHFQGKFSMLLTMCLLSRYWKDISRRYIFMEVKIHSSQRLGELLTLLESDPRVGQWVKSLVLYHSARSDHICQPQCSLWFYDFPDMKGKLPILQTLTLKFPLLDPFRTQQAFDRLATSFGDSVVSMRFLVGLVCLADIKHLTCRLPRLKNLIIRGAGPLTIKQRALSRLPERRLITPQAQLDTLEINFPNIPQVNLDDLVVWIGSTPSIKTIRRLVICTSFASDHPSCSWSVGKMLKRVGPVLEELNIVIPSPKVSEQGRQDIWFIHDSLTSFQLFLGSLICGTTQDFAYSICSAILLQRCTVSLKLFLAIQYLLAQFPAQCVSPNAN